MDNGEITENSVVNTIIQNGSKIIGDTEVFGYYEISGDAYANPLNAKKTYNLNEYDFDYALYYCFDKYSIIDDVNINVTTGYKVLENNADKVDGNTYTWNITKSNKKGIKLTLDTTVDEIQEEEKQKEKLNKNLIFIIIGTLVLFAFGTVLFVFIKSIRIIKFNIKKHINF